MIKKQKLYFIANSSNKYKEKKIIAELERIAEKFIIQYPETNCDNWDGYIDDYPTFETKITDAIEEPVKKFWDDF